VTQNSASSTPPTIIINGDNPAIITVRDSYADLGATVSDTQTGQAGDTNLGYQTFLNGTLVTNLTIDTSSVATDTIDYVATDDAGTTATSSVPMRQSRHSGMRLAQNQGRGSATNGPSDGQLAPHTRLLQQNR
jgi:hypothetical protein